MAKKKPIQSKSKGKTTIKNWWLALGIAAFAFLIYANTLPHEWALDDYSAIKENYVTQQGFEGLPTIWKEHYRFGYWNSKASLYRPFTLSVFAILWEIAPDKPFVFHFFNVFFFALTGVLLFMVLRRLLSRYHIFLPLAISLLFVAHPIHVETVANIKSMDEILALLFCLKTIYLIWNYIDTQKIFYLISAVIAYGFALFSKESAITFVAIIPLTLYFFTEKKLDTIVKISVPFLIPAFIFIYIRQQIVGAFGVGDTISILDNAIQGADGVIESFAMAMYFMGRYLLNLLTASFLGHDFGFNQVSIMGITNWKVLLSILIYVGMGVYALFKIKDKSLFSYGILFYLITFSPLCNIFIKIGTAYGERIAYMPSLGYCIAFVALVFLVSKSSLKNTKSTLINGIREHKLVLGILGIWFLFFTFQTITRNSVWKNSYTLYAADIERYPNGAKLNYHYGLELAKLGLAAKTPENKQKWFAQAHTQFEKAIEIYPQYHDAYGQLGLSMYRAKQYDKALEHYQKSIDFKPNNAKVLSNMGIIYFERGEVDKAQNVYEKAVRIDPKFVDARRNLGSVYARKKQFPQAIEQFAAALEYAPEDATINYYLGSAYRDSDNPNKGQFYLDKACRLNSSFCK